MKGGHLVKSKKVLNHCTLLHNPDQPYIAGTMGEGAPDGGVAICSYLLLTNWWIEVGIVCERETRPNPLQENILI